LEVSLDGTEYAGRNHPGTGVRLRPNSYERQPAVFSFLQSEPNFAAAALPGLIRSNRNVLKLLRPWRSRVEC
jgi:hypothetical protein